MRAIFVLALVVVVVGASSEGAASEGSPTCEEQINEEPWSYPGKRNGPGLWKNNYPDCNKTMQSPIDIQISLAKEGPNLKSLQFVNYKEPIVQAYVANNLHTVRFDPAGDNIIRSINIDGVTYILQQLHFHWGSEKGQGSEHLLNSIQYDLEIHFVHKNNNGKLAVVGVLFQESGLNNTGFQAISNVLPNVMSPSHGSHDMTQFHLQPPLNLSELLPGLSFPFFRYTGSLTTPPCTEGVIWSVAKDVLEIGKLQLNALRSLYSVQHPQPNDPPICHLQDNFRPVQNLNGRIVTMST